MLRSTGINHLPVRSYEGGLWERMHSVDTHHPINQTRFHPPDFVLPGMIEVIPGVPWVDRLHTLWFQYHQFRLVQHPTCRASDAV